MKKYINITLKFTKIISNLKYKNYKQFEKI